MKNSSIYLYSLLTVICISVNAQIPSLVGTTPFGGNNGGVIFNLDENTNQMEVLHEFIENPGNGIGYRTLLNYQNSGILYGLSISSGALNEGLLFSYDIDSNRYRKLVDFNDSLTGSRSYGTLVEHPNGKMYGTALQGGNFGDGTLFEYNPIQKEFKVLIHFDRNSTGIAPTHKLYVNQAGIIFGTAGAGPLGFGLIFSYNPSSEIFQIEYQFVSDIEGGISQGGFIEGPNSTLYGMVRLGGLHNFGLLFSFDYNQKVYRKIFDFNNSVNGSYPVSSLLEIDSTSLLGITSYGGLNNDGVVFKYNSINDSVEIVYHLKESVSGANPWGGLCKISDSVFLFPASKGGPNGGGTILKFNVVNNSIEFVKSFIIGNIEGYDPKSTPIKIDNKIYGLTGYGGISNNGVLYEIDLTSNSYLVKKELDDYSKGRAPLGKLLFLWDTESIYGTTSSGGKLNRGTIFKYNLVTQEFTSLFSFSDSTGNYPLGNLLRVGDNKIVGTTRFGGEHNHGVLFSYDFTNDEFQKLVDFDGSGKGGRPIGGVCTDGYNNLYGANSIGGMFNQGVIYKYNLQTKNLSTVIDFNINDIGYMKFGELIYRYNYLYGMFIQSNSSPHGDVFRLNLDNNMVEVIHTFNNPNGSLPLQSLLYTNNSFYGMTSSGGLENEGVIFKIDNDGNFSKKHDFNRDISGSEPRGDLIRATNNKLYGFTSEGGTYDLGTIFEYDETKNELKTIIHLNGVIGANPTSSLAEIYSIVGIENHRKVNKSLINIFPNPTGTNNINLYLSKEFSGLLRIYNVNGQVVYSENLNSVSQFPIVLPNEIKNGLYYLVLNSEIETLTTKFIVE